MKALNEKCQEGLNHFMKNEGWKSIYVNAPDGAKESLEFQFYNSFRVEQGNPLSNDETKELIRSRNTKMTKEDYEYLLTFAKDPRHRAAYERCIKNLENKSNEH
jgi:hypothetical protein